MAAEYVRSESARGLSNGSLHLGRQADLRWLSTHLRVRLSGLDSGAVTQAAERPPAIGAAAPLAICPAPQGARHSRSASSVDISLALSHEARGA